MFRPQRFSADQATAVVEIEQLLYLYAYALDTRTYELIEQIFTPDARLSMSSGTTVTPVEYRAMCERELPKLTATQHVTTNVLVQLHGPQASARAYYHAQHRKDGADGGPLFLMGGWVDDELVLLAEGWRIAARTWNAAWSEGNPAILR